MGANEFMISASGKTAEEAFRKAVDRAKYMSGHGGYTGTIAEKTDFVMIEVQGKTAKTRATQAGELLGASDPRIDDKWGPAGCVRLKKNEYLFFGWASS